MHRSPIEGIKIDTSAGACDRPTHALRSRHPGGVQILLGDGSVRFVTNTIITQTLLNLLGAADGQVIGDF